MDRERWIDEAKAKLARWDSKISALEDRAEALGHEARAEVHEAVGAVRERMGKAKARLKEAREAGDDAWDDMKDRLQVAWKEQQKAVEDTLRKADPDKSDDGTAERGTRNTEIAPPGPYQR